MEKAVPISSRLVMNTISSLDLPLTPIFSGVRFRPTFSAKFGVELNYVFASAMAELKGTLSDEAFNMQLSNALSTLNSHKQQGVE